MYCRYAVDVGILHGGNSHDFHNISFYAKIPHTQKYNPYEVIRETRVVSWKSLPYEMSCQHFHNIFPKQI